MPHEFLYLIRNTLDRQKIIEQNHKVRLKSKKEIIYHWEVKGEKKGSEAVLSHIHLLSDDAFKNRAPNRLIKEHLTKMTDDMDLKNNTKDDIGNDFSKFIDRILLKFVVTKTSGGKE